MSEAKIDPWNARDIVWLEARRVMQLRPHYPTEMMSLESMSPLKDWVCTICQQTQYSLTTEPPICCGGMLRG